MAIKSQADPDADGAIFAEINITPLTDIFLVLLIVFMVTSSVMTQMGVNVQLPKASNASSESQPEGVIVSLLPMGEIQVNQRAVQGKDFSSKMQSLRELLKGDFAKTQSRLVILEGDKQAFLGSAIEVMDAARSAGAEKFAIATALEK